MEDILFQVPWQCDDKDCPNHWHCSSYWVYDDGSYSLDEFTDGDHETVNEDKLPNIQEVLGAWKDYYRFCAETVTDPLQQFYVPRAYSTVEKWQVLYRKTILGAVLLFVRRNARNKWRSPEYASKDLLFFLNTELRNGRYIYQAEGKDGFNELKKHAQNDRQTTVQRSKALELKFIVWVDVEKPRSIKAIQKEIKKAARKALKSRKNR